MLKIGDVFFDNDKQYVIIDIKTYMVNTEMHSMHMETIHDYICRRLFHDKRIGKTDVVYTSYNGFWPKVIDHVKVKKEYSVV